MLKFTAAAAEQLKESLEESEHIRVAVVGGGCAGMSYTMNLLQDKADEDDLLIEFDHVKVYIDPHSASILTNTTVDYVITLQQQGYEFINLNANTTCGCGMSFY